MLRAKNGKGHCFDSRMHCERIEVHRYIWRMCTLCIWRGLNNSIQLLIFHQFLCPGKSVVGWCYVKSMYFVPLVTQKSELMSSDNTFPELSKNSDNKYQLICMVRKFVGKSANFNQNAVIWMSHWRPTMLNGAEFHISCQQLGILRKSSHWQLIQNSEPSTSVWHQCDIRIGLWTFTNTGRKECNFLSHPGSCIPFCWFTLIRNIRCTLRNS